MIKIVVLLKINLSKFTWEALLIDTFNDFGIYLLADLGSLPALSSMSKNIVRWHSMACHEDAAKHSFIIS